MKVRLHISQVQEALLIPKEKRFPSIGPLTKGQFNRLALMGPDEEFDTTTTSEDLAQSGEQGARDISEKGADFIRHFESLFLKAYQDGGGVWTIGWGHTGLQHEDGTVYPGRTVTTEKAKQLFRYDMEQFEAKVTALARVPLNDDQYAALVSWAFNTGGPKSTSLWKRLNEGNYEAAGDELLKWDMDNGKEVAGLVRRRRSERRLFLGKPKYLLATMAEVQQDAAGKLG